jgi:hypothetical protein
MKQSVYPRVLACDHAPVCIDKGRLINNSTKGVFFVRTDIMLVTRRASLVCNYRSLCMFLIFREIELKYIAMEF